MLHKFVKILIHFVSIERILNAVVIHSICIIGDSVQRTIYKDFVTLLQENRFATVMGLKAKGEESYMNDDLVEGGVKSGQGLHNGTDYR